MANTLPVAPAPPIGVQITQQMVFGEGYSDINSLYGINAKPEIVLHVEAVQNSLYNLFITYPNTVPYLRAYGTTLMEFVFEPYDQIMADDLIFMLFQAIGTWEPRVVVDKRRSNISPVSGNPFAALVSIYGVMVQQAIPFTYNFQATKLA